MAYDAATGTVVLFGGAYGGQFLGDTWTWNGSTWTQQSPLSSPSPRQGAAMTYDAATGNVVLFSGYNGNVIADTWIWNGATWTQQSTLSNPSSREDAAMAYDAATGNVVLFGGTWNNETWTWNGTTWTQLSPTNSPSARAEASVAYNVGGGNLVVFGGRDSSGTAFNDTWQWDGSTWTQQAPPTSPSARWAAAMSYDATSGNMVLFGGLTGGAILGDTWVYSGDFSDSCTAPTATVLDGYANSVYVKLRFEQIDTATAMVCFRVDQGSTLEAGGNVVIKASSVQLPTVDSNAAACSNTPGNTVPGPHPLLSGTAVGTPFLINTYGSSGESWVCISVGSFAERVIVPSQPGAVPVVGVNEDSPAMGAPPPTSPSAGYPSGTCQAQSGSTQILNANSLGTQAWAYVWQANSTQVNLCVRLQGPVAAGGMLTVSTTSLPGISPVITISNDLTPCTFPIVQLTSPTQAALSGSPAGGNPQSICVALAGAQERLTVGTTGSPTLPSPPSVTWTPDPGTPAL